MTSPEERDELTAVVTTYLKEALADLDRAPNAYKAAPAAAVVAVSYAWAVVHGQPIPPPTITVEAGYR